MSGSPRNIENESVEEVEKAIEATQFGRVAETDFSIVEDAFGFGQDFSTVQDVFNIALANANDAGPANTLTNTQRVEFWNDYEFIAGAGYEEREGVTLLRRKNPLQGQAEYVLLYDALDVANIDERPDVTAREVAGLEPEKRFNPHNRDQIEQLTATVLKKASERGYDISEVDTAGQSYGGLKAEVAATYIEEELNLSVKRVSTSNGVTYVYGEYVDGVFVPQENPRGTRTYRYNYGVPNSQGDIVPELRPDVSVGNEANEILIPPQSDAERRVLLRLQGRGGLAGKVLTTPLEHDGTRQLEALGRVWYNKTTSTPDTVLAEIRANFEARDTLEAESVSFITGALSGQIGETLAELTAPGLFYRINVIEENGVKLAQHDEVRFDENGDPETVFRTIYFLDSDGNLKIASVETIRHDSETGITRIERVVDPETALDVEASQPDKVGEYGRIAKIVSEIIYPEGEAEKTSLTQVRRLNEFGEYDDVIVVTGVRRTNSLGDAVESFVNFINLGGNNNDFADNEDLELPGIAGSIGSTLASSLTRSLVGDSIDSQFASLAVDTVVSTIGLNLGQVIDSALGNNLGAFVDGTVKEAFADFDLDLASQGIGVASSFLTAELVAELGVDGFGGALLQGVGDQVISGIAENIVFNGLKSAFDDISIDPLTIAASYFGGRLASKVVSADTVAGQIGGSIGGSIGAIAGGKVIGSYLGKYIGALAGPIGVLLGTFLGKIFGTLIGDLFGATPRSGADLDYDSSTGEFRLGQSWSSGSGSRETAEALASQVGEILNSVLGVVGGELINPLDITPGHYGTYKSRLRWAGEYGEPAVYFEEAGDVVAFGALVALEDVKILGGDIHVKRALYQSLENQKQGPEAFFGGEATAFRPAGHDDDPLNDPEIEILLGDLSVAQDYANYLKNAAVINALIAAEPNSAFAAGWIITLQRAHELGLHRRHESDWFGGWEYFLGDLAAVSSTVEFSVDVETKERLTTIENPATGAVRVVGDTISSSLKDEINGTTGQDTIVINGATLDGSASSGGLTVNGETLAPGADHDIDTAAIVRGGDGNDVILGGDRGNDLYGDKGNDSLRGGATADWLFGGEGNDTLDAGASDDGNYLSGGAGDDSLIGAAGSDWLAGGDGADALEAGEGDDILDGGAGVDLLRGGAGDDRYIWRLGDGADDLMEGNDNAPASAALAARLAELSSGGGAISWSATAGAAYTSKQQALGGADTLVLGEGISFDHLLFERAPAASGQDYDDLRIIIDLDRVQNSGDEESIVLREWFDPLKRIEYLQLADGQRLNIGAFKTFTLGTSGDDTLFGTNSNDFINGGDGNDEIHLLGGDDFGVGGAGDDIIAGDDGNDIVVGGDDADRLMGGSGSDFVVGGRGDDDVYGGDGSDIIIGDEGDDTLIGGNGSDIFKIGRGDGRDVIFDALSDTWEDVWTLRDLDGDGQGDAFINGYAVDGGRVARDGNVIFEDGEWIGRFRYDWNTTTLQRHITPTSGPVAADNGLDRLEFDIGINITDLYAEKVGGDLLIGISDEAGAPASINGFSDLLTFRNWFDLGAPIEIFAFVGSGLFSLRELHQDVGAHSYAIAAGSAGGVVNGDSGKNLVFGSVGDETLNGGAGDDALLGQSGEDSLRGEEGDDALMGGAGDDVLIGGAGADTLDGGAGRDVADYSASGDGVFVNLAAGAGFGGHAQGDALIDVEDVVGSDYDDVLTGDGGENELRGGLGADTLRGGLGEDVYVYRMGDGVDVVDDAGDAPGVDTRDVIILEDVLLKDAGFERDGADLLISFAGSSGAIRIENFDGNGRIEDLVFADGLTVALDAYADAATNNDDFLVGAPGGGVLQGLDGDDTLSGRGEADRLEGGAGDDLLAPGDAMTAVDGGAGVDTLYFGDLTDGVTVDLTAHGGASPVMGTPIRMQAEDFTIENNFFVSTRSDAEMGLVLRSGNRNSTSVASYVLSDAGPYAITPGYYDIRVTFFDENDGVSVLDLLHNDVAVGDPIVFDQTEGADWAAAKTLRAAVISSVYLDVGDKLTLSGLSNANEAMLIDAVELTPHDGGVPSSIEGLNARYFVIPYDAASVDDIDFSRTPLVTDVVGTINYPVGTDRIHPAVPADDFVAEYSGFLNVSVAGDYTFYLSADDFAALEINGVRVLNIDWLDGVSAVTVNLTAGAHAINIKHHDTGGAHSLQLEWESADAGIAREFISGSSFTTQAPGSGQYSNIENVIGGGGADAIIGDAGANRLDGLAGGDTLDGNAGADTISGGDGNDSIGGGAGDDILFGDDGADVISGDDGADLIYGGAGGDVITTGAGGTTVEQNSAGEDVVIAVADTAFGDAGDDTLIGGADADSLIGGAGHDSLSGGGGDDTLVADGGDDIVDGGAGADVIIVSAGAASTGQTRIVNATGYDVLEIAIAGAPEDLWFTMDGAHLRIESFAEPGRSVLVENWVETGPTGLTENRPEGVRTLYVNGQAISHGAVTALANELAGINAGGMPASLDATNRQAVLDAHAQYWQAREGYLDNETLTGGVNDDVLTADANLTGGVLIDGAGGHDTLTGADDNDTISGGAGDDVLVGLGGDDLMDGGAGNDDVAGGDGDDTLVADGADSLQGGAGSDVFEIEAGADGVEISETAGDVSDEDAILLKDITRLSDLVAGKGGVTAGGGLGGGTLQFVAAVNVGGGVHTGSGGIVYAADPGPAAGGTQVRDRSDQHPVVTNGDPLDQYMHTTYRFGRDFTYEIPVAEAGTYRVELIFVEPVYNLSGAGSRVFNAFIEDQLFPALTNIDVTSLSGGRLHALALSSPDVTVSDGSLSINLAWAGVSGDQNALISGIVVRKVEDASSGVAVTAGADDLVLANGKDGSSNLSVKGHYAGGATIEYVELADGRKFALSADGTAQDGVNTLIAGDGGANAITGASGSDALYGAAGDDTLTGAAGDDALFGGDGADALNGGDGDDTLYGGAGADSLNGGAGQNWASYEDAASAVRFDADNAAAGEGHAKGDVLTNIYGVEGSDYGDVLLGADAAGDIFNGGAGDDTLDGRGGDDIFIDSAGNDVMEGGAGLNDRIVFAGVRSLYDVDSTNGTVTNLDTGEVDSFSNIEFLEFADEVVDLGRSPNNRPEIGDDQALSDTTIKVGDLYELVLLEEGETGPSGPAFIDQDGDPLTYSVTFSDGAPLPDGFWLSFDPASRLLSGMPPVEAAGTTLTVRVTASDGLDSVYKDFTLTLEARGVAVDGGAGNDDLTVTGLAGAGDDTLRGFAGDDTLEGGAGADMLDGGAGSGDRASYRNASTGVAVDLGAGQGTAGDADGDVLIGIEGVLGSNADDTLDGSDNADALRGYAGADHLRGLGGDDTLTGDGGLDTLDGGAGDDLLAPGDLLDHVHGGAGADTLYLGDLASGAAIDLRAQGGATGVTGRPIRIQAEAFTLESGFFITNSIVDADGGQAIRTRRTRAALRRSRCRAPMALRRASMTSA